MRDLLHLNWPFLSACLSFMPVFIGWAVQDVSTSRWVSVFTIVSHSFRMETFFLLAGFLVSALQWQMPSPVARTVTMFAQASAALSLFVIGGSLAGLHEDEQAAAWEPGEVAREGLAALLRRKGHEVRTAADRISIP